jgi:hypothetical protein
LFSFVLFCRQESYRISMHACMHPPEDDAPVIYHAVAVVVL